MKFRWIYGEFVNNPWVSSVSFFGKTVSLLADEKCLFSKCSSSELFESFSGYLHIIQYIICWFSSCSARIWTQSIVMLHFDNILVFHEFVAILSISDHFHRFGLKPSAFLWIFELDYNINKSEGIDDLSSTCLWSEVKRS